MSAAESSPPPFDVLVGRGSTVATDYKLVKLPRVVIIGKTGKIVFSAKAASADRLKEEVERAVKNNL